MSLTSGQDWGYPCFEEENTDFKPGMDRPKRRWRRHSLGGAVEDLASSASLQIEHLRGIGEVPNCDDLALDFDKAYAAVRGTLKMDVEAQLERLEAALADMRGKENAELWHTDALHGPEWSHVRGLAGEALHALDQSDTSLADSQRVLVKELAAINPALDKIKRLHLDEYPDLLPHVLLGDFARFFMGEVRSGCANLAVIMTLLKIIDDKLQSGDESVQVLIDEFFVENLLDEDPQEVIERMLPPHLRNALEWKRRMMPLAHRWKPEARALAYYMSQISEAAYCAEWMLNLEHALWRAVNDGPFRYGQLELTPAQVGQLRHLSAACAGWIRIDDTSGDTFVPLEEWRQLYDPSLAQ